MKEKIIGILRDKPEYEKLLEKAIFIEENPPKSLKSAFNICNGPAWRYNDIREHPSRIFNLVTNEIAKIPFQTNKVTYYQLEDREATKEALGEYRSVTEAIRKPPEKVKEAIPDDLFSPIAEYDDIKDMFWRSIEKRGIHILLGGPPATAKTLFMDEIARLPECYYVHTGGRASKAGLADIIYESKPRFLVIDEIGDINPSSFSVLKPLMENGSLNETIRRGRPGIQVDVNVYGTTNKPEKLPEGILSRFVTFHFDRYTEDEFMKICKKYLTEREEVGLKSSEYIAERTWNDLDRDVRTARSICRLLREETKEDIDKCVRVMKRYQK